ncbi:MAG: hypothetical protein IKU36_01930 [Bacteroidales bacterium]|nr:hypothetical protein [Bacteroidales bacterium]
MKKINYVDLITDCVVKPAVICPVRVVADLVEEVYMVTVKMRYYLSHPNGTYEECNELSSDYNYSCGAVLESLFDLVRRRKES